MRWLELLDYPGSCWWVETRKVDGGAVDTARKAWEVKDGVTDCYYKGKEGGGGCVNGGIEQRTDVGSILRGTIQR